MSQEEPLRSDSQHLNADDSEKPPSQPRLAYINPTDPRIDAVPLTELPIIKVRLAYINPTDPHIEAVPLTELPIINANQ